MRQAANTKKPSIKALTIRQPFPELILRGRKPFEIRSWRTHYRGPLLIHAGMKIDSERARESGLNPEELTTSAFVGVAVLSDVRPYTREDAKLLKKNQAGGGWEPNLFSWVLKEPRRFPTPTKAKGRLGLFGVSRAVERRIGRLLSV
jgi:ASCH domain-containing protein